MALQPGNFDPAIPLTVANYADFLVTNSPNAPSSVTANLLAKAEAWTSQAEQMRPGGDVPWWASGNAAKDEVMMYKCDAALLGNPSEIDCTQIEWQQLGSGSSSGLDTVTVGPGRVEFFHQSQSLVVDFFCHGISLSFPFCGVGGGSCTCMHWWINLHVPCCDAIDTCTLAISAAVTLVLTWAQVRTALATLMSVCVANPVLPARGGRAFYGSHTTPKVMGRSRRSGSGRSRKRRGGEVLSGTFFRRCPIIMKRILSFSIGMLMYKTWILHCFTAWLINQLTSLTHRTTGWNALPPHANLTIFQQLEPWTDSAAAAKTCSWNAVLRGEAVDGCRG